MRLLLSSLVLFGPLGLCTFLHSAQDKDPPQLDPDLAYQGRRSDPVTYEVDLSYVITAPCKTKKLRVWLPLPQSDAIQEVSGRELSTFPAKIEPKIGKEKVYGNHFAYFEFDQPQSAQVIRHKFTVKTWEVNWHVKPDKVLKPDRWPASFDRYLRSERFVPVDERFRKLAQQIVPERRGPADDLVAVMTWINQHMRYDHVDSSLRADAVHAIEKKAGHCSDYHGLCTALGRSLGYPTRVAYGINPLPRNSPSHCKLEAFLPPYGWVPFDLSETQQLVKRIEGATLSAKRKQDLSRAATDRLQRGFRDNTWFLQTRGTDYELEPPAAQRAAVVRTIYAEADGVALPDPDPANAKQREFAWMSVHHYRADREVVSPFADWRSLER